MKTRTRSGKGQGGEAVRYAVGDSSLGTVLVAGGTRGVCAVFMGDDPVVLAHELDRRFPRAERAGTDARLSRWVARVVAFVESPRRGLDLPLDVRGTDFQRRVWQALREIPAGSTACYAEVAGRIGAPTAVRAVAAACAANPVALAIPCHRVVAKGGALSGYHWGVDRKRALLEREAAATSAGRPSGSRRRSPSS